MRLGGKYNPDLFYFTYVYDGNPSITVKGKILSVKLHQLEVSLPDLPGLRRYKEIIRRVNVYATAPIDIYDWAHLDPSYLHYTIAEGKRRYNLKCTDELTEGLKEKQLKPADVEELLFYRVAQFALDDTAGQEVEWQKVDFKNITTRPTMPVDGSGWMNTSGRMLVYNNRLHLYNLRETLADLHLLDNRWSVAGGNVAFTVATYIKCVSQDMVVLNRFTTAADSSGGYRLPAFVSFPDSRAYKMELFRQGPAPQLTYRWVLTPSTAYNYAFAFPDPSGVITDSAAAIPAECISVTDGMRLIVSEAANPYYFPPQHSYLIPGEIINAGVSTAQISASQIGQYPLYLFTEEGIYALQTGEGTTLYSNLIPISAEVAVKGSSILQTRYGILFVTDKGLRLIAGQEVADLSEPLDGPPIEPLCSTEAFRLLASHPDIGDITLYLSTVPFRDYSRQAVMGYDSRHEEVIVSNTAHRYSYVYSLGHKTWHKIGEVFAGFNRSTALRYLPPVRQAATASVEIQSGVEKFLYRYGAEIDMAYSGHTLQPGQRLELRLLDASGHEHQRFGCTTGRPLHIIKAAPLLSSPAEGLHVAPRGSWMDFSLADSLGPLTASIQVLLDGSVIYSGDISRYPGYTTVSSLAGQTLTLTAGSHECAYVVQPDDFTPQQLINGLSAIAYPGKTVEGNRITFRAEPGNAGNDTPLRFEAPGCKGLEFVAVPFAGGKDGRDTQLDVCNINNETETPLPVYLHTRPLAGGYYGFKKLRRMVMRGELRPVEGKWWQASLFASNNLTVWCRVASRYLPASAPQLQLPEVPASYRYFALMAGGEVEPGHVVAHTEWEAEPRYNGHIR